MTTFAESVGITVSRRSEANVAPLVARLVEALEQGSTAISVDDALAAQSDALDAISPDVPLRQRDGFVLTWRHDDLERTLAHAIAERVQKRSLSVVTGGPGTGKTHHAATLIREAGSRSVLACAPSGKAAARIGEELGANPDEAAMTVHRALGLRPDGSRSTRAPIDSADLVIVDEASMLDAHIALQLFTAAPAHAHLVLLGDAAQLPSVGVGRLLADIVAALAPSDHASKCLTELTESRRFPADRGVGLAASATRRGDADGLLRACDADPQLSTSTSSSWIERVHRSRLAVADHAERGSWEDAFGELASFGVLSVTDAGARSAADELQSRLEDSRGHANPVGSPLLATKNAARLHVLNGDVGLLARPDGRDRFMRDRAAAPALSALPGWRSAHALTVHKAQGSQYDHVVVLLPDDPDHPLLSRNIMYTAITRARQTVEFIGSDDVIRAAVERETHRTTALVPLLTRCLTADA